MALQGWIRIHRKIKANPLWDDAKPFSRTLAWIDLLMRAAYQESGEDVWFMGNTIHLGRGELVSSLRILAKEWGWSKNKVDRFLNQLTELKMIEKRDTSLLRIYIVNYGKYQPLEESNGTQKGHGRDTSNKDKERKEIITLHRRKRREINKKNEKNEGEPSQSGEPSKPRNPDIKRFIDFFCEACHRIRNEKPVFTRGKDGWLVKLALKKLSESQLEQLALWFLEKKKTLSATIGAMLSKKVLESLRSDMNRYDFWKEINAIYDKHYPMSDFTKELTKRFKPFTYQQITEIQEEVSGLVRPSGIYRR